MAKCELLDNCDVAFTMQQTNYNDMYKYYCIKHPDECIGYKLKLMNIHVPSTSFPNGKTLEYNDKILNLHNKS